MAELAFRDFELDDARFELRRAGQRVPVQAKVLKLLLHLARNRARAVPVGELLATLWPGERVGVASVKRAVQGARAALGESGGVPSAIRNVRGHGYQFVLPVHEQEAANAERAPAASGDRDPFAGREDVLSVLDAALRKVLGGRGANLLFVGEPGIGKTRTLRELARRASALGILTCFGRCSEVDGAPALWPVLQIMRAAMTHVPAGELRALLGSGAADVAEAFPELGHYLGDLAKSPEIDSVAARFRFFDSMASFVRRVAERSPIAILIDDLQRADDSTLQLLGFLSREIDGSRVLLAAATRPLPDVGSDGAEGAAGAGTWGRRVAGLSLQNVELHGFGRREIGDFLAGRLHSTPPEDVVTWLEHRTAGNPLFLDQVLRDVPARCEECGRAAEARPGDAENPCWHRFLQDTPGRGLHAAVERHLHGVSDECRAVLRAAAVLGREFSLEVLSDVAEISAEHLLGPVQEAASAGILGRCSGTISSYRFAHVLIREALYEQLSIAERARLHWQAGLTLEARGVGANDALVSELAEHFVIGGAAHGPERALRYTLRAAETARRCLAYEHAAGQLGRALTLLEASAEPAMRLRLLLEQGEMLKAAGKTAAARASLLHAAGIARMQGAGTELARAAALFASTPETGTVDPVQVDLLNEALAALSPGDDRRPWLRALLAKSLLYARDPEGSTRLALEARAEAASVASLGLRAEILQACHDTLTAPSCSAARHAISEELTRIGHDTGDHRVLLRAASFQVWNAVELGDMARVDAAIATLERLAEHAREPFFRWHARSFRSMRAMVAGRLHDAVRLAREAYEIGRAMGDAGAYHAYCAGICGVLHLQGRMPEVEALVRDVSSKHPTLGAWTATLANVEAELGKRELARGMLARLLERDLDGLRRDAFVLSAIAPATYLCSQVGTPEQARQLYEAALPYEHHHANVSVGVSTHGPLTRHLGMLALRMGELDVAERHLERAIAAAELMPSPTFVALGSLSYAHALLSRKTPPARTRAVEAIFRAFDLASECEMHVVAVACRNLAQHAAITLETPTRAESLPHA